MSGELARLLREIESGKGDDEARAEHDAHEAEYRQRLDTHLSGVHPEPSPWRPTWRDRLRLLRRLR